MSIGREGQDEEFDLNASEEELLDEFGLLVAAEYYYKTTKPLGAPGVPVLGGAGGGAPGVPGGPLLPGVPGGSPAPGRRSGGGAVG